MAKKNRLSSLFEDFANRFEFQHKIDDGVPIVKLVIPFSSEKSVTATYTFDASGDSYEYSVAIGKVEDVGKVNKLLIELLERDPSRGITEQITNDGQIIVIGSRSGLKNVPEAGIRQAFTEDITFLLNALNKRLAGDSSTDAPPPDVSKKKKNQKEK